MNTKRAVPSLFIQVLADFFLAFETRAIAATFASTITATTPTSLVRLTPTPTAVFAALVSLPALMTVFITVAVLQHVIQALASRTGADWLLVVANRRGLGGRLDFNALHLHAALVDVAFTLLDLQGLCVLHAGQAVSPGLRALGFLLLAFLQRVLDLACS